MRSENYNSALFKLTDDIRTLSNDSDLVITVSNNNPVHLYLSHRKGWAVVSEQLDSAFIAQKRIQGAKWLIGEKSEFNSDAGKKRLKDIFNTYKVMKDEKDYFIVMLQNRF